MSNLEKRNGDTNSGSIKNYKQDKSKDIYTEVHHNQVVENQRQIKDLENKKEM